MVMCCLSDMSKETHEWYFQLQTVFLFKCGGDEKEPVLVVNCTWNIHKWTHIRHTYPLFLGGNFAQLSLELGCEYILCFALWLSNKRGS